jgi:hypothetical protein
VDGDPRAPAAGVAAAVAVEAAVVAAAAVEAAAAAVVAAVHIVANTHKVLRHSGQVPCVSASHSELQHVRPCMVETDKQGNRAHTTCQAHQWARSSQHGSDFQYT